MSMPAHVAQIRHAPSASGLLYGIGVGPGDPDLLTLRAVKALHRVEVILAASSSKNDYSVALSIARPHLPAGARVVQLPFPMTRDNKELLAAWDDNARQTLSILRQGKNAAFLTLGDPLVYSTFGYLLRTVRAMDPDQPVEIIPGITSFQAAAARTGTILCEGDENLLLMSGVNEQSCLESGIQLADNAVILKAYKNLPAIKTALVASGRHHNACFVSRLGLSDEHICPLNDSPASPNYLSLVLAPTDKK